MSEFLHDDATAERAREVMRKLIESRDEIASSQEGIAFEAAHKAVAPHAWSWWMLITDSARIVLDEAERGYGFVVAPVMRNLMNHTVALKWLVDGGDSALKAVDAYSDGELLKLIENAQRVKWQADGPVEQMLRQAIAARDANPDPDVTKLTNEIKNAETLMVAYGIPEGYVPYRHLSAYTHTSRETAQLYLAPDGQGGWALRATPRGSGLNDVLWASVCLIQAGRVIDGILTGQPLAQALDEATAHLGLPENILPRRREKRRRK
ncbi:DUF5677 domain-containing protein [Streptomyces sp.]|uniref:DUF5677 domain-containing protein n=1 Tax=Streptomyces sp. TaxID=1931 RepID=UPI002D784D55|nr:DUF5677 domain-containing protein [Streptomyces sp.]HET6357323.1 DUF5677 domain-containing protein [Streptomyces sp.]